MKISHATTAIAGVILAFLSMPSIAQPSVVSGEFQSMTFGVFGALVAFTLAVTWWAARRNRSVGDFYTGGGGISGLKNGLAISGDYLSAAAFLGVSGLIALYGFDGILYVVGFFVGFVPVLLLIAEPCRNLGRYTLSDVLAFRNGFRSSKTAGAISSVCVAIFYLIPQVVGGGVIIKALVGIEYEVSVLLVGALMLVYVLFGGMRATTWVQLIKAVLLIGSCFVLVMFSWAPFGFDVPEFVKRLLHNEALTTHMHLMFPDKAAGVDLNRQFFQPGLYLKNPMEQLSLGLALVLGTAAMPHVLMRFFTVRDAVTARSSVLWAMLGIGVCHVLIVFIGFAAAYYIGSPAIAAFDKGGNLAAPLLAQYLGGGTDSWLGNFMLAFTAAVAFATIVAVVAGLTLAAASALAHDLYVGAIQQGKATERQQAIAARIATLLVGVLAITVSLLAKGQNVAHLVGLAYAVAASANLPALLLTIYWKQCNTWGVLSGVIGGTTLAIGLVLVSPNMTYPDQVRQTALTTAASLQKQIDLLPEQNAVQRQALISQKEQAQLTALAIPEGATSMVGLREPLVSLRNPGLISIPAGFILVIVFSLLFRDPRSQSMWAEMSVRQHTGIGIAAAESH